MDRRIWQLRIAEIALCENLSRASISEMGARSGDSMGQPGSKAKVLFVWSNLYEKQNLSRKSRKKLPRDRNYEESVPKKQREPDT